MVKTFVNEDAAMRLRSIMARIHEMEKEADKIVEECCKTTRFLDDEQRQALIDYFAEAAKENSDPDDSVDRYLETSYYEPGSSNWTDRDLLADFAQGYMVEMDRINQVPLWKDVLSHNLAAVAVMGEFLLEQEGR